MSVDKLLAEVRDPREWELYAPTHFKAWHVKQMEVLSGPIIEEQFVRIPVIEKSAYDSIVRERDAYKKEWAKTLEERNGAYEGNLKLFSEKEQAVADAKALAKLLVGKQEHDEDCADQDETFGPDETCECGAIMIRAALTDTIRERYLK